MNTVSSSSYRLQPQGCLICEESGEATVNEDNAVTLSKLLGSPGSRFSELLQSATYCPSCVHLIDDIGQIFADVQILEEKLDDWKKHIEGQLKNSYEVVNLKRNGGTEFLPSPELEITSNQDVRKRVISQLSHSCFSTFVRRWNVELSPEEHDGVTRTNQDEHFSAGAAVPQTEMVLSDLISDNVSDDYLDVDGSSAPSPAASFRSSQSFEEKFNVSSEALPGDDTDLSIDMKTMKSGVNARTSSTLAVVVQHAGLLDFVKLQEKKKTELIEQKSRPPSKPRRRSCKIPCPFSLDCKVTISRNNEINIDAHRLRYHEGVRKCYVCKTCGTGFTGCNSLESHLRDHHNEDIVNISVDESLEIDNEPSSQVQVTKVGTESDICSNRKTDVLESSEHKSEIAESRFPIILLDKLRAEDIAVRLDVAKRRSATKRSRTTGGEHGKRPKPSRASCTSRSSQLQNYKSKRISTFSTVKRCKIKINFLGGDDGDNGNILRSETIEVPHFGHFKKSKLVNNPKPDKIDTCSYCGKRFSQNNKLISHLRLHTKERPFICEVCGESFRSTQALKYHKLSRHDGAYKCNQCDGKQFSSPRALRDHIKMVHTKVWNIICEVCGFGALTKSRLARHTATKHSEDLNFKCHLCPKSFKTNPSLRSHLIRHADERKFACRWCGKKFIERQGLRRHELIHSKAQCHECEVCGKTFPVRNYLYIHMRSHNKTKTNRKSQTSSQVSSVSTESVSNIADSNATAAAGRVIELYENIIGF